MGTKTILKSAILKEVIVNRNAASLSFEQGEDYIVLDEEQLAELKAFLEQEQDDE